MEEDLPSLGSRASRIVIEYLSAVMMDSFVGLSEARSDWTQELRMWSSPKDDWCTFE